MIGLLGGTFNPVHWGHVRLALNIRKILGLERVELVPCAVPPHKPPTDLLPYALRLELLQAVLDALPEGHGLSVSTLESSLPGPSYTWNLLTAWASQNGQIPLFILGDEDFAGIDKWYRGLELPAITDLAVIGRSCMKSAATRDQSEPEGRGNALFVHTVARFWPEATIHEDGTGRNVTELVPDRTCRFVPVPPVDVSASQVRALWKQGQSVQALVPPAVMRVLQEHGDAVSSCWQPVTGNK